MMLSSNGIKPVIAFFCLIIILIIFVASLFNSDLFLLIFTFTILCLSSVPIFLKETNLFSIWSFIFYGTFLFFLRSIYMVFGFSDQDRLNDVFFRGEEIIEFVDTSIIMLVCYVFLIVGYLLTKKVYIIKQKKILSNHWDNKRYLFVTGFLLVISIYAIFTFVTPNGGLVVGFISKARGVSENLQDTNPQGYLRLIASIGFVNVFISALWLKVSKKYKYYSIFIFIISFLSFLFFNFYVSQRGVVVFLFVQLIALFFFINNLKFSKVRMFLVALISLTLLQAMSSFRSNGEFSKDSLKFNISLIEPAIMTINFIDLSKTKHIIDAVPKKLPFAYGKTYFTAIVAPIPRSIWKNKPVVNVDNIVGQKVYGSFYFGAGGTPAGLIAEAYWNFWYFGFVFVPIFFGFLLRYIENTFQKYKDSQNVIILYVSCFLFLGLSLMGSSFSSTLVGFLKQFIVFIIVLNFISKKNYVKSK